MPVNKTCPICLESFIGNKIDKFVKLPCKHLYHEKCITKYFNHYGKETCPCTLCRKKFNKLNLKDREPLKWILRNRTNTNISLDHQKIDELFNVYLIDPIKNIDYLEKTMDKLHEYIVNISSNRFMVRLKNNKIMFHLKTATSYMLSFVPVYKKVKKNKNVNVLKTDFVYFLSKLESRNYINQKTLNKIYKSI